MRIDKYPGIMDISHAGRDGVEVPCAHCGNSISRYKKTIERMMAIDGFVTCSNSCRVQQAMKTPPSPPCA